MGRYSHDRNRRWMRIGWTFILNPKVPDFKLPEGRCRRALPCLRPFARNFPLRARTQIHPLQCGQGQALCPARSSWAFSRNVIVQATCHGKDNRAMVDACRTAGDLARGHRLGRGGDLPMPNCRTCTRPGCAACPVQLCQTAGRCDAARGFSVDRRQDQSSTAGTSWSISKRRIWKSWSPF